jgi:hypothetical protein
LVAFGGSILVGSDTNVPLLLKTNATERARIDSSGNLLVGGTSALVSSSGRGNITVNGSTDSILAFGSAGTNTGYLYATTSGMELASIGSTFVRFSTNGSERARIDSSGNLLVGTTTRGHLTDANTFDLDKTDGNIYINHATGTPSGYFYTSFGYGTAPIGSVTQNGTTGVLFNTSSDYRLKNITGPITNSGEYIDSLNPVEGTWKADGSTFVGLIAHEVQEASRTPVATGTKDGEQMQGMDYSSAEIIANLIAEVKSLRARLAAANI